MGCLDSTPQSCLSPTWDRVKGQPACPALCKYHMNASSTTTTSTTTTGSRPDARHAVVTLGDNHKPDTAIPLYRSLGPNCTGHTDCGRDIALAPFDPFRLSAAYGERAAQLFATHGVGGTKENTPFFLYIAFAHTHTPLAYTPAFNNASTRPGRLQVFGNTLAEADHTIGVIVDALEAAKLGEKTLIFIASDNGPADLSSVACEVKGSPGPFTGAWMKSPSGGGGGGTCKGTVWEGGHRTVGIARWRGSVAPRVSHALTMTVDFMTTFVALAGGSLRTDRVYDGVDLSAVLGIDGTPGDDSKGHTTLFHPHGSFETTTSSTDMVPAMRVGKWKAHWITFGEERYVYKSRTHRARIATSCTLAPSSPSPSPSLLHPPSTLALILSSCRRWNNTHGPLGPMRQHDPPLIFDLDADPSESTPIDPTTIPDVVASIKMEWNAFWKSVNTTLRSYTNYSQNATHRPCGNHSNAVCRTRGTENSGRG